jgi:hypothetical protein
MAKQTYSKKQTKPAPKRKQARKSATTTTRTQLLSPDRDPLCLALVKKAIREGAIDRLSTPTMIVHVEPMAQWYESWLNWIGEEYLEHCKGKPRRDTTFRTWLTQAHHDALTLYRSWHSRDDESGVDSDSDASDASDSDDDESDSDSSDSDSDDSDRECSCESDEACSECYVDYL